MTKDSFFKGYLRKRYLKDDAYDCSEIADDFYEEFGEGKILKIYTKDIEGPVINIPENGEIKVYVEHYVYSDGKYVYDPRYAKERVLESEYLKHLQDINKVELKVEEDK